MFDPKPLPRRAGVGLKHEHYGDIFGKRPDMGFFEIHAENYMGAGGLPHRALTEIRKDYPLSVHGVGLSIGAERGIDPDHLARLKAVVDRYEPGMVSEHLAWSTHDSVFLNDLLPLPYTEAVLRRVVAHVDQVQTHLGRVILMENPSTYVAFAESEMSETDFVGALQKRSGCGLLLDVNNVFVSATNQHYSPKSYIDAFPLEHVGEIHLGGHATDSDDNGEPLLIDAHDREVSDPVWTLYAYVLERTGRQPTLIEWDNDLPQWNVLAGDAARAEAVMQALERHSHAA
ncbi:MAG: DUF692 domain-containing protein [Alphaproteobacteria bacterium]|nr:DUF692 domain-containing protein [Alphaproteobacteria bacterium]